MHKTLGWILWHCCELDVEEHTWNPSTRQRLEDQIQHRPQLHHKFKDSLRHTRQQFTVESSWGRQELKQGGNPEAGAL